MAVTPVREERGVDLESTQRLGSGLQGASSGHDREERFHVGKRSRGKRSRERSYRETTSMSPSKATKVRAADAYGSPSPAPTEVRSSGRTRKVSARVAEASGLMVGGRTTGSQSTPPLIGERLSRKRANGVMSSAKRPQKLVSNGLHHDQPMLNGVVGPETPSKRSGVKRTLIATGEIVNPSSPQAKNGNTTIEALKGILTPTKKRKYGTPRKSVAWTDSQLQEQERSPVRSGTGPQDATLVEMEALEAELDQAADEEVAAVIPVEILEEVREAAEEEVSAVDARQDEIREGRMDDSVLSKLDLDCLRRQVLCQVSGHHLVPPVHLDAEFTTLHTLVSQTVRHGESNSLLVLGGPGSGKNLLMDTVLGKLSGKADYREPSSTRVDTEAQDVRGAGTRGGLPCCTARRTSADR